MVVFVKYAIVENHSSRSEMHQAALRMAQFDALQGVKAQIRRLWKNRQADGSLQAGGREQVGRRMVCLVSSNAFAEKEKPSKIGGGCYT